MGPTMPGVAGWPVAHSRSPAMQNAALAELGLGGWRYQLLPVPPEAFAETVRGLGAAGFHGANVTIPHKAAALAVATTATDRARAIGAANTLWLDEKGRLNAGNTDAYGFITNLEAEAPDWNKGRRPVTVLGAGGAARAILHGLLTEGAARILLANRTRGRAEALARAFGPSVSVVDWEDRAAAEACILGAIAAAGH